MTSLEAATKTTTPEENGESSSTSMITILGFGSLLSENSSRITFPDLENFRLGRVPHYRRIFRQPTSLFFRHDIANLETKEMASLSAEPWLDNDQSGFICSIFEVPNTDIMADGVPSAAFLEREEEYNIVEAEYINLSSKEENSTTYKNDEKKRTGILCTASSDEVYLERWGSDHFDVRYGQYGVPTIWGWQEDSGLRPCRVYLRHCYLAAKSLGQECLDSFLDETFLVDRKTTIRKYLQDYPDVLADMPPPALIERYSG